MRDADQEGRNDSTGRLEGRAALDQLMEIVYKELRALAAYQLQRERSDHTLQPTALVHEAYLNLVDQTKAGWQDRAHFCAVASKAMRRILIAICSVIAFALPAAAQGKKPLVVATFSILGDLAQNVGKDLIELKTLVGPDGAAHVYEPRPADAIAVSKADVLA